MWLAALDAVVWSSLWLALAAAALLAASARALGVAPPTPLLALAFGGTLAVYAVDRLRDVAQDRATAPERTAFVERHRSGLTSLAGAGAIAAAGSALWLGPRAVGLAVLVGALGLAHRRLKRWLLVKPIYLTFAWTAVPVGLPALHDRGAQHVGFAAAVVFACVLANVALSNLRDREGLAARLGPRRTLAVASAILLAGLGVALLAPAPVRALAALPVAMGLAVAGYRPTERYGGLVVDGALLVGALAALALGPVAS
jgi:4-hydroxybenzoate polyprenyltransferase